MIAGGLTATAAVTSQQFKIMRFFATRWGFDQLYARTLINLVLDLGRISWSVGDKGLLIMRDQKIRI
jgi:hypothetical protein